MKEKIQAEPGSFLSALGLVALVVATAERVALLGYLLLLTAGTASRKQWCDLQACSQTA